MKVMMLIYHSEFHDEITEVLEKECGIMEYVEVPKVWGMDDEGRHIDTHVWPGTDSVLFAPLPETKSREALERLRLWKSRHSGRKHVRALILPVEEAL